MILSRMLRFLICLCGLSSFAWALLDVRFRDAEGSLTSSFGLPVAMALALIILGLGVGTHLRNFALWFAVAAVGQAVALELIEAGPLIHYQHYMPFSRLLADADGLLLVYLLLQAALVMRGLKTAGPAILRWMGHTFEPWRLAGIALASALPAAALSRDVPAYAAELTLAILVQAINLGTVILMVRALPDKFLASLMARLDRLLGAVDEAGVAEGRVDRLALLFSIWVLALSAFLSFFVYERHPHIQDEIMYLYQARYLAAGALTESAAPVPEVFTQYMVPYKSDRWYSPFPPGWPAVLALGVLAGVPWLVNPLLAALNMLLSFALLLETYDRRTARFAALLLSTSPWYIFMSMNFMSHTFTLTATLVAALGTVKARKSGRPIWAFVAGGAVGLVSLIRPMDSAIVGGLIGLWAIGLGGQRLRKASLAALVLGVILIGGVALPYNWGLTGNPTMQPLEAYYEEYFGHNSNALGFGPERGLGWPLDAFPGHSPLEAGVNAGLNFFSVNVELFGWSTGSLILVALLLFSRAARGSDYLMLAVVVANLGAYSLYWFNGGPDFGARYWYLMIVPLVALSARGAQFLAREIEGLWNDRVISHLRVSAALVVLCSLALVNYVPWRAVDKYYHYLGMRPDIPTLAGEYGFGKSLVLIRGESHPDYASAWAYNPLDLQANAPIYAWDRDPAARDKVLRAYWDRPVWVVDGPSITKSSYVVVEGPIQASELMARDAATFSRTP